MFLSISEDADAQQFASIRTSMTGGALRDNFYRDGLTLLLISYPRLYACMNKKQ